MNSLYVESSAVLALLLDEARGKDIAACLSDNVPVVTSALTFVECDRAFFRRIAISGNDAILEDRRAALASLGEIWSIMPLEPPVLERARQAFPFEPVRALDALHMASALVARGAMPGLAFVSLDGRVRKVAPALGFNVLPA